MSESKLMPRLSWERWAAIRYSAAGCYYVEEATASATEAGARRKADAISARGPEWAMSHPILAVVLVTLTPSRFADRDALAELAARQRREGGK